MRAWRRVPAPGLPELRRSAQVQKPLLRQRTAVGGQQVYDQQVCGQQVYDQQVCDQRTDRCVVSRQVYQKGEESVIQSVRLHSAQKVGRIHEAVVLLALPFQADDVVCWADVEILPDNWLSQHVVHFEDSHGAVRRVIGLVCCEVKYFHLDLRELVGATNEHQGQEHPR